MSGTHGGTPSDEPKQTPQDSDGTKGAGHGGGGSDPAGGNPDDGAKPATQ